MYSFYLKNQNLHSLISERGQQKLGEQLSLTELMKNLCPWASECNSNCKLQGATGCAITVALVVASPKAATFAKQIFMPKFYIVMQWVYHDQQ